MVTLTTTHILKKLMKKKSLFGSYKHHQIRNHECKKKISIQLHNSHMTLTKSTELLESNSFLIGQQRFPQC